MSLAVFLDVERLENAFVDIRICMLMLERFFLFVFYVV